MIEPVLPPSAPLDAMLPMDITMDVEAEPSEPEVLYLEDGSVEITFDQAPEEEDLTALPHDANLAEHLPDQYLMTLGMETLAAVDVDRRSREDWEKTYKDGLQYLGFKAEERAMPWEGACNVVSTLIPESVIRFQANAIMEIYPASGPVLTKIVGDVTKEKLEQADRVRECMNYTMLEKVPGCRIEYERMLFALALCGSGFKKIYTDPITGNPMMPFVPSEDMILPYGALSVTSSPRVTQVLKLFKPDIVRLQVAGQYRDVPIDDMTFPSELKDEQDKVSEQTATSTEYDPINIYESHLDLDIPHGGIGDPEGVPRPYILTFDQRGVVLALRRNWQEGDPKYTRIQWFAQYTFIPGFGPYGFGYLHFLGMAAQGATSIQRQLIDAGTLANLPAGYKTTDARVKGDDTPIMPGEFRDVDLATDKLKEAFFPLPFKEPSQTLLALLHDLDESGRRLGSIADAEIGDLSAQAPVGTTLALMERSMKIMSAANARIHASMKDELRILARIIRDSMPDEYAYDVHGASRKIKRADFDDRVDIIPVSDPNAASLPQKITLYQLAIQLSQQAPQIYDIPELHRQFLTVAGIKDVDRLIPDKENVKPMDPVAENMAIVTGKPVKAFEWQDHKAHIQSHTAFIQDPATAAALGQNPQAQAIAAAAQAHIAEHFAYDYRNQIEQQLGVPLPPLGEPLPGDIESQLSVAVAAASQKLLQKHQAEAAQQKAQEQAQDPVLQMQRQELQIQAMDVQSKAQERQAKLALAAQQAQMRDATERERIASQERMAQEAAIDKNEQFLAKSKLEKPLRDAEVQDTKAATAEKLARIGGEENGE